MQARSGGAVITAPKPSYSAKKEGRWASRVATDPGHYCTSDPSQKPLVSAKERSSGDEQVGWQLIPTTIAYPLPRRNHQAALKNRRREDGQVGWRLIPTTIAHLIPRRTLSVAIAMPTQSCEKATTCLDHAAMPTSHWSDAVEKMTNLPISRRSSRPD
jgi:hypothetical protein